MKTISLLALALSLAACAHQLTPAEIDARNAAARAQSEAQERQAADLRDSVNFQAKMVCNSVGYPDNHPQFSSCQRAMYTQIFEQRKIEMIRAIYGNDVTLHQ